MKKLIVSCCVCTILPTLACILEPYKHVDNFGICSSGSDEYNMLVSTSPPSITTFKSIPDTIVFDYSRQEIPIVFRLGLDSAYWNCGSYRLHFYAYTDLIPGFGYHYYRPENIEMIGDTDIEKETDTMAASLVMESDSSRYGFGSRSNMSMVDSPQVDPVLCIIRVSLERYVGDDGCCFFNLYRDTAVFIRRDPDVNQ